MERIESATAGAWLGVGQSRQTMQGALREQRLDGADLGPEGLGLRITETRAPPDQGFEGLDTIGDRRARAFQP